MNKWVCFTTVSLLLLFLGGCEPPATFDAPQPVDVKALGSFPLRIQGNYLSSADSSLLQITANSIIRIYDFDQRIHVSQIDSNQQIIGDTLFDMKTNKGEIIQFEGDSIVIHVRESDTIFALDDRNVLKKFKGYYFVNISTPPDTWQVKKLDFSQGTLTMSSINKKEDIDQLKSLSESTQDTMPYVFSPTRSQFKDFVRNKGFRDSEKFTRIRNREK